MSLDDDELVPSSDEELELELDEDAPFDRLLEDDEPDGSNDDELELDDDAPFKMLAEDELLEESIDEELELDDDELELELELAVKVGFRAAMEVILS